ncbi:MAG: 2-oxoacid:ferredoxin oxidoreductase subunit gamma, partial [Bacilli bacterium]|nr:2-oxoacid:ferredoxin oxidoreductase subunit gamma [Bacilli bacterium]
EITKLIDKETIIKLLKKSFGEEKAHLIPINDAAIQAGIDFIKENYPQ